MYIITPSTRQITQIWWLAPFSFGPWQIASRALYDLSADIGEKNNLAEAMPDKAAAMEAAIVVYLKAVNAETAPRASSRR